MALGTPVTQTKRRSDNQTSSEEASRRAGDQWGAGCGGGACSSDDELDFATLAIHAGLEPDPATGAILTPICQSTTYVQSAVGVHKGHTYSRASNPTVSALERVLGALEDAPPAVCFGTGMGAITGLLLGVLKTGDHILLSDVIYGGTVRLVQQILEPLGISATFVDCTDVRNVAAAINERTKIVLVETPGNPTLKLVDVASVARVTRTAGVLLAVDNTFLTPAILRPLELGADVSVYSTTKYIEGHNSTVGGSLVCRDAKLLERFRLIRKTVGSIQSPFEAWLTLRGVKTLGLRLRRHCSSALTVAKWLEKHPKVVSISHPGLESFPQRQLALRQHGEGDDVHGGIVAFEVVGGVDAGIRVMNAVKLCSLAENLGAAETLITHPVSMTHGDVPRAQRLAAGITDGLVRLSVGLEEPRDIIRDLEQALAEA